MKLNIKIVSLIKTMLISATTVVALNSAVAFAGEECDKQIQSVSAASHQNVFSSSPREKAQIMIIKKIAPLTVGSSLNININKLSNFNLMPDVSLVLVPNKQEFLPLIVKKSGGNKLFEIVTQFNDKLQLFIARFKKTFTAKNTPSNKFPLSSPPCSHNCDKNS